MHIAIIVPVAALIFLAAILLVPAWLQNRARLASLRLVHAAIDHGQPLDAAMVDRLLAPPRQPSRTNWFALICFFFGVLGLCVGSGLSLGAIFFGHSLGGDAGAGLMLGGMINGFDGFAQTVLGLIALRAFSTAQHTALETVFAQVCLFIGVSGIAVGFALALGAQLFGAQFGTAGQGDEGMMLGALMSGFSGLGLTALGITVWRLFGREA